MMFLLPSTPAHADSVRDAQWQLPFLHAADAHRISQGEGVTVAVIDTGVDASHPDLAGNVLPGTDFVTPGGDGTHDGDGHGTDMAGLIAAHGRGEAGTLGIAPKAKILPVRVGQVSGLGEAEVQGIEWAAQHDAKVMCIALAGGDGTRLQQAIDKAFAADVLVVAGVGNRPRDTQVRYPAAYPGVIAAAAVDKDGNHADVSVTGKEVMLAAPGVDVISTNKDGK
jgi:subtilisin family serine protease